MLCLSAQRSPCPLREEEVTITLSQDVEGGYGCALSMEPPERDCSLQSSCPYAGSSGCLLVEC